MVTLFVAAKLFQHFENLSHFFLLLSSQSKSAQMYLRSSLFNVVRRKVPMRPWMCSVTMLVEIKWLELMFAICFTAGFTRFLLSVLLGFTHLAISDLYFKILLLCYSLFVHLMVGMIKIWSLGFCLMHTKTYGLSVSNINF